MKYKVFTNYAIPREGSVKLLAENGVTTVSIPSSSEARVGVLEISIDNKRYSFDPMNCIISDGGKAIEFGRVGDQFFCKTTKAMAQPIN